MYKRLLLTRFVLINGSFVAASLYAYTTGAISYVLEADTTYISHGIVALFLVQLYLSMALAFRLASSLEAPERTISESQVKVRLGVIFEMSEALVMLGLIGTVVGFIMVMGSIDPSAVADVSKISSMVSNIGSGMGVALHTTLVGSVFYLWSRCNIRLLSGAAEKAAAKVRKANG